MLLQVQVGYLSKAFKTLTITKKRPYLLVICMLITVSQKLRSALSSDFFPTC